MSLATQPLVDTTVRHALLEHIARYRMTVLPAVQQIPVVRHRGRKRIGSYLRQLCRTQVIGHAPLYRNRRYFYITPSDAASHDGIASTTGLGRRWGPLSERAKITNYAILTFCLLADTYRQRLTASDFQRHFPDLYRPGLPLNYYVDASGSQPHLGFVRVDTGGRGRWDRVLAKCRNDLESHYAHSGFCQFIQREAFEITLITPLPQKARRLSESIAAWSDPRAGMISICTMPELLHLIAPPPT